MKLTDLDFTYPDELIATEPQRPSRVMLVQGEQPQEITLSDLLASFDAGDVLVINDTLVLKRRVFVGDLEVLFLKSQNQKVWEVLFPSRKFKVGDTFEMPLGVKMTLVAKGRPQLVETSEALSEDYFSKVGELPLPPYIQKAREARHNVDQDQSWYQTAWAQKAGSFAAPTASLHFSQEDLNQLRERGVDVCQVTLHVGLGTFLPVTAEDLDEHDMHSEFAEVSLETWQRVQAAKAGGKKVWALGTTAVRSLESVGHKILPWNEGTQSFCGETKLLIQPGYQWQVVDVLMTNFHQPQTTLLALVSAFAGLENVQRCYQWAIERKFKLFSYGDLSVWRKS
ncbi:MAG: tRNA preQ1(34) S-adenosylmethionine ribosyltransferase-isomerase QueA [Bdellovibrionia bacterium]